MAVSESFRIFALDQLGRVFPVTARSMFGGAGIYAGRVFFALIDDDVLYFKVDDSSRAAFRARDMGPFRPYGDDGPEMQYYAVPAEVLDDVDLLRPWAQRALRVAQTARARRAKRR